MLLPIACIIFLATSKQKQASKKMLQPTWTTFTSRGFSLVEDGFGVRVREREVIIIRTTYMGRE
jgi:hypothetical protein